MEGQGSKTSESQGSLNEGTQAQHFEFGVESEFWFMLEVRHSSAHSAKQLHQWITGLLKDTTSQILGVKYLKDGEFIGTRALRPQHVFVYGKDFKTIQLAWNRLSNRELAIRDISKVACMDEPSKSTPSEVLASAQQVGDRTSDDNDYASIGVKVSDHKKTPWNNLEKNQTSLRDAPLNLGASQKSKIHSSRGDACKATIQEKKRYQCHQNKRMSYENDGTVTTEPKLWPPNTCRINNAAVGKEDEHKLWSNTDRFKNDKEDETRLWSNTAQLKNAIVDKEDETKLWSNTRRFKNATVGKEDEPKPWSSTGRFKNNVQPLAQSFNFTLGTSLDNVDERPTDHVAVKIHDEPFSRHLSLKVSQMDGQNEANAEISEIKAVQENRVVRYYGGVIENATARENASEQISVSDETESVCDLFSESSTMSDFSEGSELNKDSFLVILRYLPLSMKRQEIIALLKGIYPGFVKVFRSGKKGKAIAVFSSKEHASNCAKQMNGKFIHGSKIVAFAKISKSNSNLDKDLLKKEVPGANEKVSNWLESKHLESEEFCTEDVQDQQQEQKHQHQQQQMQQQQTPQPQKHKQQLQNQQPQKQQHQEPQLQEKRPSQKQSQQKPRQQKQKQQQSQQTQTQQSQETQPLTRKQRKQLLHEKQQLLKKHEIQLQQKQQEQKPLQQQKKTLQQQQQLEQLSQEQLQMQQKQRHPQEQLSSQQQQRKNDKEKLLLLLQQQLVLKQQQQQVNKVPQNHAVQLRGFPHVIEASEIRTFIHEWCEGVEILNIVKDVEDLEKYFVKLKSQNDCQKVKEALQRSCFKGKEIKSTWTERKNANLDKPYVVVENLLPHFKSQDVMNFFAKCKGVVNVNVAERAKKSHARVYFESVDLAGEAVKEMRGFCVGNEELRVTPGVGISEELEWRKLECQVQEYLELLQKSREVLLRKNDEKLNDLENNTPDPQPRRKKVSLEEFVRREETKKIYEGKKQELKEQRSEFEKKFQQLFENFNQQVEEQRSVNNKRGIEYILKHHKSKTDREFRKFKASLPIYAKRTEILETIQKSQVVVLIGETGSGKSTQVAQYLAEETLSPGGKIVVTQPRKIAAISLAKRVSEEFGCKVGQEVGYHVGLDKKINNKTIIKFVTDRILLNEVLKGDEIMPQYSCIVIDEAHERSIHTDLLVAMLKRKLTSFPHLKLIVTSATLNTEIFRTYFDNCPLVKVPGRTFPVERVYSRERPADYVEGVYDKVVEVCQSGEQGDILVFLTQQNEIEKTCDKLEKKLGREAVILPLHGKLQSDEQQKVFEATPKSKRKIVIATNSAETSLTIDGIRVVIDSGMVKEPSFDPERNMTTLDVKLVSKSSAEQRAGRAGRTGPGKCYCMYTKDDYSDMEPSTKPEILKMHLGMAVLQLLSLGVTDIKQFDFVESPSRDALKKALETLKLLDALNDDGTLNVLGEEMLKLPTEPQLSKALLEGLGRGCGGDVIIAAALMSSGHDVFYRGTVEKRNECAIQKQEFCQISGDLLSAIDVYKKWSEKSPKSQVAWCKENALNSKLLRSARETFNEIRSALSSIRPAMRNLEVTAENIQESLSKSLLAGYFENIAWSFGHEKLGYMAVSSNQKARIHPSSVLCSLGDQPEWVLYQQIKRTNDQVFLINVTPICYEWLAEVAMHMLQYIDEETIARLRVVRHSFYPVGPELVKAVIGYQGSTIKQIETSVSHYSVGSPDIFCAVECNVDKGMVDVYTTADSLDFATQQVEDVIQEKRCELQSFSEVFVSNVGGLKTLVASDLTTRLILQPGTSCKFNVFVEKEDVSEEVQSDDVLAVLNDTGNVIHHAINTNPKDERNFRWGSVTYSDVDQAEEANHFLRFDLDQNDLPYNVRKIQLRPIPTESVASQIYTQPSGVTVLVSWFPLPASGKAYIKCNSRDIAVEIVDNLNQQMAPSAVNKYNRAFLQKSGGDIALPVQETDNEFTVKKQLKDCCTELQNETILKIVVPSKPSPDEVDRDAEKAELVEVMKDFGSVNVLRPWVANCKKVCARVVFENLDSAEDAILKLDEQMDVMGARAMYLELESRREVTCDGRMYDKIRKEIDSLKNNEINIEVEPRGKRKKIIITGEDPQDVQTIGAKVADLVRPEVVMIEEAVVAKLLGSGYGRGKVKQIQRNNDVIIQTSNFGRRIQIMGKPKAKRQTQTQIEKLIEDLQKTTRVEINLRSSERPVGAIREILKHFGNDLNKLVEGEDCQAFMQVKRRKLEVHGEKKDVYKVQNKLEEFLKTLPNTPRNTNVDRECPVCFADVEDPYLLTLCGHAYCSDCITQYVNNIFDSVKSADMFPQKCMFDKCESAVIKDDYSKLLNTEQLQKLYLASLECFLIGNPTYKPCSTPNCSWVYEVTPDPSVFSCPECDTRLCKKCGDTAHEKFDTCEAYKASKELSKSEQQLKEWAKGADTRMCPKCAIMIEKNKGCSHVNCRVCNAHICWKCGKFFKGSDECYSHIEQCKA